MGTKGGGPITELTAEGGYWGNGRGGWNKHGGYREGKQNARTLIGQQSKAGNLVGKG